MITVIQFSRVFAQTNPNLESSCLYLLLIQSVFIGSLMAGVYAGRALNHNSGSGHNGHIIDSSIWTWIFSLNRKRQQSTLNCVIIKMGIQSVMELKLWYLRDPGFYYSSADGIPRNAFCSVSNAHHANVSNSRPILIEILVNYTQWKNSPLCYYHLYGVGEIR